MSDIKLFRIMAASVAELAGTTGTRSALIALFDQKQERTTNRAHCLEAHLHKALGGAAELDTAA